MSDIDQEIVKRVMRLKGSRSAREVCRKAKPPVPESTFATMKNRGYFSLDVLAALAPALGTTLADLIDPAEERPPVRQEVAAAAFERVRLAVLWAEETSKRPISELEAARELLDEADDILERDDEEGGRPEDGTRASGA